MLPPLPFSEHTRNMGLNLHRRAKPNKQIPSLLSIIVENRSKGVNFREKDEKQNSLAENHGLLNYHRSAGDAA